MPNNKQQKKQLECDFGNTSKKCTSIDSFFFKVFVSNFKM